MSDPVIVSTARTAIGTARKGSLANTTGEELAAFIHEGGRGADLLVTDAMYGDESDKPKRWDAQHLTFAEAATLARDGAARRLWLTHFGPALHDPAAYLDRATAIFPATTIGYDGMTETFGFDEP